MIRKLLELMSEKNGASMDEASVARVAARRQFLLRGAAVVGALTPARALLAQGKAKAWDDAWEMEVAFQVAPQEGGGRYHRPYVAVWVEDKDGVAVRTLALWVQKTGRGPRWHPDLKRWFRGEKTRQLADGGDLIASIGGATRMPGAYKVVWNGKDDQGQKVKQGVYTVYVEAAREHGTYQILKKQVAVNGKPARVALGSNVEIASASLDYRRRK